MKVDCLVAEIGSTTTKVLAFNLHNSSAQYIGRGMYRTTVESDVTIGLNEAIEDLKRNLNVTDLIYDEFFSSSSAAGGLKITCHGLVYEMTAKAAKEAALNAGANVHLITANLLEDEDILKIKSINPNIIVIAGGTDYGEKKVSFSNLEKVIPLNIPIIYAGNIANHDKIRKLYQNKVTIVDNVYPRVDFMNILPLREAIYNVFEKNIIYAKGMKNIFKMINGTIIPTPGAVMDATIIFDEELKGVMSIDVGGATTDIHSVCDPKPEYIKYSEGEPRFKRTVEGDLGVFINRENVLSLVNKDLITSKLNLCYQELIDIIKKEPFIPKTINGKKVIDFLVKQCVFLALDRHIGDLKRVFTTNGYKVIPEGRDVSQIKTIFLTGGALRSIENPELIIKEYINKNNTKLIFSQDVKIYVDKDYILSSCGVLSHKYPKKAKELLFNSLIKEITIDKSSK